MKKECLMKRPLAEPNNGVGQCRFNLFRNILARIDLCVEGGYPIEALALEETFISDRLNSQIVHFLGRLKEPNFARKIKKAKELNIFDDALLDETNSWRLERNKCIHGLLDIDIKNLEEEIWENRFRGALDAARRGRDLALRIHRAVDKVKRVNKRKCDKNV